MMVFHILVWGLRSETMSKMRRCARCGRRLTRGRKFARKYGSLAGRDYVLCHPKDETGCKKDLGG